MASFLDVLLASLPEIPGAEPVTAPPGRLLNPPWQPQHGGDWAMTEATDPLASNLRIPEVQALRDYALRESYFTPEASQLSRQVRLGVLGEPEVQRAGGIYSTGPVPTVRIAPTLEFFRRGLDPAEAMRHELAHAWSNRQATVQDPGAMSTDNFLRLLFAVASGSDQWDPRNQRRVLQEIFASMVEPAYKHGYEMPESWQPLYAELLQ